MVPAQLAAGVPAADGDFAAHDVVAIIDFQPSANGIAVGAVLMQRDFDKVTRIWRHILPDLHIVPAVHDQKIDFAIQIEIGQ